MDKDKILQTLLLHTHERDQMLKEINKRITRFEATDGYTGIIIKSKDFILPDNLRNKIFKYPNIKSKVNTKHYSKQRISIEKLVHWFNNLSVLVKKYKVDYIINELYFFYDVVNINDVSLKANNPEYKPHSRYENLKPDFLCGIVFDFRLLSRVIQSIDNLQDGEFITIKWGTAREPVIFESTNVFLMIMPRLGAYK